MHPVLSKDSAEPAPAPRDRAARVDRFGLALVALMSILFLGAVGRVAQIETRPGGELDAAIGERISRRPVRAIRGDIVDRRGRLLATSRLGYRAFVDPLKFPDPPHEAIMTIASIVEVDAGELGERVVRAMETNRALLTEAEASKRPEPTTKEEIREQLLAGLARTIGLAEAEGGSHSERPALRRYVRAGRVLTDEQLSLVRALDIPGVHLERAEVREYAGEELAASIVGKVGFSGQGLLGAEYAMEDKLAGRDGRVKYVRDAYGRPLWIEVGDFEPAEHGGDVRLSIDLEVQRIAREELERGISEADAAGGRLVVLDPYSGEILAMIDVIRDVPGAVPFEWIERGKPSELHAERESRRFKVLDEDPKRRIHPALARNRCVEDIYEPGSTFKSIIWAGVTQLGYAAPDETFDTHKGLWRTEYGRLIRDVLMRDEMTWREVLVNSSNIGMSQGAARLSPAELHEWVTRFGFGNKTGVGLPGETGGLVTPIDRWSEWTTTSVSFGYEVGVTPVQMVRAYSAFARRGDLAGTMPISLRLTSDGSGRVAPSVRVMSPDVAVLTRDAMAEVAEKLDKTIRDFGYGHQEWSYDMFGKSGTAKIPLGAPPEGHRAPPGYRTSFIAGAPRERARLVVIAVIDDPGPERIRTNTYYGSHVAGPIVRRVVERTLSYLGVAPVERKQNDLAVSMER
jgi:cell division protein FtsI (penicillin-binding protein 3)